LRTPEGAGGRERQYRPVHAAALSGKALKGKKPQGRRCDRAFTREGGCRNAGKPAFLGSGSVLGQPLKRSRSPGEDLEYNSVVLGGLEGEDPEVQPATAKDMRGVPKP